MRVTRSLLLITAKAPPITSRTIAPANKLDIKFANEGVMYKIPFYFNKVKNSKIDYTIYCINFCKKIKLIFKHSLKITYVK